MAEFEDERRNVGDGWQPIILQVHHRLTELVGDYKVTQIKEKFGGLRYYYDLPSGVHPEVFVLCEHTVQAAEAASFEVCEVCGDPGKPSAYQGWVKTVCATHQQRREGHTDE